MKPRTGVYLSDHMAARLTAAAARTGATKSALIEAALDRFLESQADIEGSVAVASRLTVLSRQLERLDRDLRIVNETVALHARFHLAVTPPMPIATQPGACELGSERFQEFAAQVGGRVDLGTSLMQETMDRLNAKKADHFVNNRAASDSRGTNSTVYEPDISTSAPIDGASERPAAAVREDGSIENFPEQTDGPLQ